MGRRWSESTSRHVDWGRKLIDGQFGTTRLANRFLWPNPPLVLWLSSPLSLMGHEKGSPAKIEDDFIAPARRAFARVARRLRLENKILGLPLSAANGGKVKAKTTARTLS